MANTVPLEVRVTSNAKILHDALVEILDRTNREKARDYDAALNGGILEIHDIANTALVQERVAEKAGAESRPFVGVDLAKDKPTYTCVEISLGNAAVLHEVRDILEKLAYAIPYVYQNRAPQNELARLVRMAENKVREALAAPPRNCDVGTAEEQAERFEADCKRRDHCTPCPVHAAWGEFKEGKPKSCQLIWAQMPFAPAQEGGAE